MIFPDIELFTPSIQAMNSRGHRIRRPDYNSLGPWLDAPGWGSRT
jgi:hypothetical protein